MLHIAQNIHGGEPLTAGVAHFESFVVLQIVTSGGGDTYVAKFFFDLGLSDYADALATSINQLNPDLPIDGEIAEPIE